MKALVLKEYSLFEIAEFDVPQPGADDVLVAVKACGICGSDVHGMDGSTGRRLPPIIMGHEAAGLIAEVGSSVTGWTTGERVTFDSTIYCGKCAYCREGRINLCDNRRVLGVSCTDYRQHGAFAEYVVVPQHILYRLPDSVSFAQAAMVEALSIAVHAVGITPVRLGDRAVVVGAGTIGLLIAQALKAAGCGMVVVADIDKGRLDLAANLGATAVLDAKGCDVLDEVLRLTSGRGADLVFEAVGAAATVDLCLSCVRKGGAVTLVGNASPKVELALQSTVTREITLRGSCASAGEYPACLDLIGSGAVNVDALISAVAPLTEGPAWFDRLYKREPGLMKVILEP
jgi:L-iditol 2-dehydrogenase